MIRAGYDPVLPAVARGCQPCAAAGARAGGWLPPWEPQPVAVCRVYYEDTDLAGIVYYANYLKFIERARTEWVRGLGVDQVALRAEHGIVFAVRRVEADYLRPARFDDELVVRDHGCRAGRRADRAGAGGAARRRAAVRGAW